MIDISEKIVKLNVLKSIKEYLESKIDANTFDIGIISTISNDAKAEAERATSIVGTFDGRITIADQRSIEASRNASEAVAQSSSIAERFDAAEPMIESAYTKSEESYEMADTAKNTADDAKATADNALSEIKSKVGSWDIITNNINTNGTKLLLPSKEFSMYKDLCFIVSYNVQHIYDTVMVPCGFFTYDLLTRQVKLTIGTGNDPESLTIRYVTVEYVNNETIKISGIPSTDFYLTIMAR